MKKTLALIFTALTLLSACFVPASAGEAWKNLPESEDAKLAYYNDPEMNIKLVRIEFFGDYTSFGDKVSVDLYLYKGYHETGTFRKLSSGDAEYEMEACTEDDGTETKHPVLYIKNPGAVKEDEGTMYAVIGKNSVKDAQGNSNSAFRVSGISDQVTRYYRYYSPYDSRYRMDGKYFWSDSVSFETAFPLDLYVNGELREQNIQYAEIYFGDEMTQSTVTVELKKCGITVEALTYDIAGYGPSKQDEILMALGDGATNGMGAFLRILIVPLLLPIFPLGTIYGLTLLSMPGPIMSFIDIMSNLFGVVFS